MINNEKHVLIREWTIIHNYVTQHSLLLTTWEKIQMLSIIKLKGYGISKGILVAEQNNIYMTIKSELELSIPEDKRSYQIKSTRLR